MKILQVCSGLGLLRGGAEGFCISLSRQLKNSGHDAILLVGAEASDVLPARSLRSYVISDEKTTWKRKLLRDYYNPKSAESFLELLKHIRPDLVHFHSFYGLPAMLAYISSRSYPTVITLHDTWAAYYDGAIVEPKFWLTNNVWKLPLAILHRTSTEKLFGRCTLVSPSLWLKDFFQEHSKFPTPRHIPNAVTLSRDHTYYDKEILWVGEISSHKGLQEVISEVGHIAQQHQWRFTIAGDGPLRDHLERLHPHVHFMGYVDPTVHYRRASILIISSTCWENFPTVVLEAMQYGLCIIGHNLAGIAEIVSHGKTGLLYNSIDELGALLTKAIKDPHYVQNIGQAGRSFVRRKYNWTRCVHEYTHLYRLLINKRSPEH